MSGVKFLKVSYDLPPSKASKLPHTISSERLFEWLPGGVDGHGYPSEEFWEPDSSVAGSDKKLTYIDHGSGQYVKFYVSACGDDFEALKSIRPKMRPQKIIQSPGVMDVDVATAAQQLLSKKKKTNPIKKQLGSYRGSREAMKEIGNKLSNGPKQKRLNARVNANHGKTSTTEQTPDMTPKSRRTSECTSASAHLLKKSSCKSSLNSENDYKSEETAADRRLHLYQAGRSLDFHGKEITNVDPFNSDLIPMEGVGNTPVTETLCQNSDKALMVAMEIQNTDQERDQRVWTQLVPTVRPHSTFDKVSSDTMSASMQSFPQVNGDIGHSHQQLQLQHPVQTQQVQKPQHNAAVAPLCTLHEHVQRENEDEGLSREPVQFQLADRPQQEHAVLNRDFLNSLMESVSSNLREMIRSELQTAGIGLHQPQLAPQGPLICPLPCAEPRPGELQVPPTVFVRAMSRQTLHGIVKVFLEYLFPGKLHLYSLSPLAGCTEIDEVVVQGMIEITKRIFREKHDKVLQIDSEAEVCDVPESSSVRKCAARILYRARKLAKTVQNPEKVRPVKQKACTGQQVPLAAENDALQQEQAAPQQRQAGSHAADSGQGQQIEQEDLESSSHEEEAMQEVRDSEGKCQQRPYVGNVEDQQGAKVVMAEGGGITRRQQTEEHEDLRAHQTKSIWNGEAQKQTPPEAGGSGNVVPRNVSASQDSHTPGPYNGQARTPDVLYPIPYMFPYSQQLQLQPNINHQAPFPLSPHQRPMYCAKQWAPTGMLHLPNMQGNDSYSGNSDGNCTIPNTCNVTIPSQPNNSVTAFQDYNKANYTVSM